MDIVIDCEFDGHNGQLMSIGAVTRYGNEIYIICQEHAATQDPWVVENVLPVITSHNSDNAHFVPENEVGALLRDWVMSFTEIPTIIADSHVDIWRFCKAVSTSNTGEYEPSYIGFGEFKVYDIDSYPTRLLGAVRHNAWWDACALADKLRLEGLI